jgi:Cu(I)/Ag(I) efflux system membrane fusion protein
MHPQYHSEKPGDCPICGMKLVPDSASMPVQSGTAIAGQGTVTVSPTQEQLVGVKVAPVETRDLFVSVRASARVAYDPGLYSAILEHQAAVEGAKNSAGSTPFQTESEATVNASALRLRQMGLSDEQIKLVSAPGFDPSNLLLGKAGGTVWVYAEIYDYEAGLVKPGQEVDLTSPSFPGRTIHGTVRAVDSIVNAETRTLRARIVTPNPDGSLKPDMYLNAAIHAGLGHKLAVPEAAVIDTGTRQLVFVQTAPGQFEPREIEIGHQADGYFEVRNGLKEGEMVSTAANFLIDSESKLKAATGGQ